MKVAIILANGFEEIEAVSLIDILRRAEIDAVSVGLDKKCVCGAHGVELIADEILDDMKVLEFDMIVLPGGLPGAENLAKSERLGRILRDFDANNAKIGAICAAPWALATAGVLKSAYTCYPGFEKYLDGAQYTGELVTVDGNIITGEGPAAVLPYAYRLLSILVGEAKTREIEDGMRYTHLMA